jgi:proteasome accessory factor B
VGDLDVFFDDEPGYKIPQKSYELNVPNLTGRELAILSIAANFWNDSVLAPNAQSGIRKLQSLGIPASLDFEYRMKYRFENPTYRLEQLTKAISQKSRITFAYDSSSLNLRHLEPYRIVFWNGFWYLIGMDLDREAMRLFKLSRFTGEITISKKKNEYSVAEDFRVEDHLPKESVEVIKSAKIRIKKEAGLLLRNRGKMISEEIEFDTYQIEYENETTFLRELIWHGPNIQVVEPAELKAGLLKIVDGVLK